MNNDDYDDEKQMFDVRTKPAQYNRSVNNSSRSYTHSGPDSESEPGQFRPSRKSRLKSMTKILLALMVRNESKIIERCLDAALPHSDATLICDTGSVDNTLEVAKRRLELAVKPFM